jgi:hypothetical protein
MQLKLNNAHSQQDWCVVGERHVMMERECYLKFTYDEFKTFSPHSLSSTKSGTLVIIQKLHRSPGGPCSSGYREHRPIKVGYKV